MIFLYRKGSIQPFTKGLPSAQLLDCLTEVLVETESNGGVQVREEALDIMHTCLQKARDCNEQHLLLRIPYMTLFEYLQVGTLVQSHFWSPSRMWRLDGRTCCYATLPLSASSCATLSPDDEAVSWRCMRLETC